VTRSQSPVGKTHDKLGAALMRFGLPGAIREARILDVNASTPGFAEVLLERSAAHVASVSAGPTPLSPRLQRDPRVSFVERAEMKNLPAAQAPGPFSFFTVDVRFVSSRSMLRAIAFRLAPGAHGIVWVRPFYEAAVEHKNQSLTGGALRERAMAMFAEKALKLGFTQVAQADPPKQAPPSDVDPEVPIHILFRG
jgi:23S rRNA (cytidine1920-2'-O)/16S rRNA (cytidine1409-2'-O)-methyltransferase